MVSASVRTFDLCIKTINGIDHQFRGIQRDEWQKLCDFMVAKSLRVEKIASVKQGPAQHVSSVPLDDMDLDIPRPSRESDDDESDPDFDIPPEHEEEEEHEDSDSSSGAEMIDEAEISEPEVQNEDELDDTDVPLMAPINSDLLPSKSPKKRTKAKNDNEGQKKKRKKKDKNAPKKNMSAYMFFNQEIRESVRQEHPGQGIVHSLCAHCVDRHCIWRSGKDFGRKVEGIGRE